MNIVFLILSIISLSVMAYTNPVEIFPTMIKGARDAIELGFKLLAIYSVWLSILRMMEETGVDKVLSKMLSPITKFFFKDESEEARRAISINFSANLLGMGGVATPEGMKAMALMKKDKDEKKATANMILFMVIAATSIQLIPATVIALRATAGSKNPSDIIAPALIATSCSTVCGIILCKLIEFVKKAFRKMFPKKENSAKIMNLKMIKRK